MKIYVMLFGLILLLFSTHLYLYSRGLQDGEWQYKRSNRMAMALESAYNYGTHDGYNVGCDVCFHNGYSMGWINGYHICNKIWERRANNPVKNDLKALRKAWQEGYNECKKKAIIQ